MIWGRSSGSAHAVATCVPFCSLLPSKSCVKTVAGRTSVSRTRVSVSSSQIPVSSRRIAYRGGALHAFTNSDGNIPFPSECLPQGRIQLTGLAADEQQGSSADNGHDPENRRQRNVVCLFLFRLNWAQVDDFFVGGVGDSAIDERDHTEND